VYRAGTGPSLDNNRNFARSGHLDLRAQAEVPSALRTDTPTRLHRLPPARRRL